MTSVQCPGCGAMLRSLTSSEQMGCNACGTLLQRAPDGLYERVREVWSDPGHYYGPYGDIWSVDEYSDRGQVGFGALQVQEPVWAQSPGVTNNTNAQFLREDRENRAGINDQGSTPYASLYRPLGANVSAISGGGKPVVYEGQEFDGEVKPSIGNNIVSDERMLNGGVYQGNPAPTGLATTGFVSGFTPPTVTDYTQVHARQYHDTTTGFAIGAVAGIIGTILIATAAGRAILGATGREASHQAHKAGLKAAHKIHNTRKKSD